MPHLCTQSKWSLGRLVRIQAVHPHTNAHFRHPLQPTAPPAELHHTVRRHHNNQARRCRRHLRTCHQESGRSPRYRRRCSRRTIRSPPRARATAGSCSNAPGSDCKKTGRTRVHSWAHRHTNSCNQRAPQSPTRRQQRLYMILPVLMPRASSASHRRGSDSHTRRRTSERPPHFHQQTKW